MRPIDRGDMQAWLGVLQTQMSAFTERTHMGSVTTTLHQGWLEKRGEAVALGAGAGWKRRFFVLSSRQEQQGEAVDVQYYLHYFKSEEHASETADGGVIDLGDVEEVALGQAKELSVVTETRVWLLRAETQAAQEEWMAQLSAVCGEATGGAAEVVSRQQPPPPADDVTSVQVDSLKMQVPGPDGQPCWKTATFDLQAR
eukprot:6181658-Pleurochrysis_carterae.AAC.1